MARDRRSNATGTYYLLDMGGEKYGDSILCDFGATRILIDGGHARDFQGQPGFRSIPDQLKQILGLPPFKISLLVVTHCHADHIGCLPDLVKRGILKPDVALVADENLGFGQGDGGEDAVLPDAVLSLGEELNAGKPRQAMERHRRRVDGDRAEERTRRHDGGSTDRCA
jgi:glyoxylase-like metal-dependent hydrolase (beta-lactamase superfamily II)